MVKEEYSAFRLFVNLYPIEVASNLFLMDAMGHKKMLTLKFYL